MRGFGLMLAWLWRTFRIPELRRIVLWALALALLAAVAAGAFGFWAADALFALWAPGAQGAWGDWVQAVLSVGEWLLAGAIAWLAFVFIAPLAASPWGDRIVQSVEQRLGVDTLADQRPWWRSMLDALVVALRPWLGAWRVWLAALLLFWLPVIGPMAAGAALAYGGAKALVFELMDPAASRSGWGWSERMAAFEARKWDWLGLGLAALLLAGTLIGALLVPVAGVAAASELLAREMSAGLSEGQTDATNGVAKGM